MSWIHNSNPFFWGVIEICMQMQVCSINPIGGLAKGYIPHMYVRTTMSFGGAIAFPLVGTTMEDLGAYTRSLDTYFL